MNREGVIHMAREAGWTQYSLLQSVEVQRLEKFAELVAAAEREACAKVCENHHGLIADSLGGYDIADAIRARGKE